jgi:hypothetical protein
MTGRAVNGEVMGPLERGRSRYQQKNYTGALDAFTEVGWATCASIQVLLHPREVWIF